MDSVSQNATAVEAAVRPPNLAMDAVDYWVDAAQRWALFLDVLAERGSRYREHAAKAAPHVLSFECSLIMDGRKLPRPVNYGLVRIVPPGGIKVGETRRPFVVVDPRAGHGPGIGGFKAESEIGVVLRAGHPCYFIGFLPEPVPGQTIEDIALAEAAFLEHVIALHPLAEGKPAVVGNCQAGWALMLLAAMRPELFGPIIVAGSPLAYWAGVHGKNPMRYTGGLCGGTWLAALMGDLGNGKFDGAWLVTNFENLNPANTFWTKLYNVYSNVDKEAPRFLEFEEWWGGHVLLNAAEMQYIGDELFVGNKLASGELTSRDGLRVDLRNIRSPIVVFCSKADNITPPQQALGWILDLYERSEDIQAQGQTIVYAVHESIGHLGIFVSGSVAKKEHSEFASNIDLIDVLPPGLYEAVLTPKDRGDSNADLITGNYLLRFEARTLDDIRAFGVNSEEDDRKFATVARLSEINLGLYRTLLQPWVQLWANESAAEWMRRLHPARVQYAMFSRANPFMRQLEPIIAHARQHRHAVAQDNTFWQAQAWFSDLIEASLNAYRDMRDHGYEVAFHAIYGSPALQALAGLKASDRQRRRKPSEDALRRSWVARRISELREGMVNGGAREAVIRALLYIRRPEGVADERGFNFLRRMREEAGEGMSLADFKQLVREQFLMLLLDERGAVKAIPDMLEREPELAARMGPSLRKMIDVVGVHSSLAQQRLSEIERMFKTVVGRHSAQKGARDEREPEPAQTVTHAARGAKHA
jgi:pimeloyl-ACP methyl ester carboxylesterase